MPSPPPASPPPPPSPLPPASDSCPQRAGVYPVDPNADFDAGRACDCSWTKKWPCGASDASRCWNECCAHKVTPLPRDYVPGGILRSDKPEAITYYAYRATNADSVPAENINLANLEGIMMYLHHEVIWDEKGSRRKFGIDRVRRYRVSMKPTRDAFNGRGGRGWPQDVRPQYTTFSAFDYGMMANPARGVPSVGCGSSEIRGWGVYSGQTYGENVTYYSLPGKCYSRPIDSPLHKTMPMTHGDYAHKDRTCVSRIQDSEERAAMSACLQGNAPPTTRRALDDHVLSCNAPDANPLYILCKDGQCSGKEPGGMCGNPPRGDWGCTFSAAEIGYIMIDDLEGKPDSYSQPGGVCFWDGKNDPVRARERTLRLAQLFQQKYPDIPGDMPGPKCPF